jgi:hypothetical protein
VVNERIKDYGQDGEKGIADGYVDAPMGLLGRVHYYSYAARLQNK